MTIYDRAPLPLPSQGSRFGRASGAWEETHEPYLNTQSNIEREREVFYGLKDHFKFCKGKLVSIKTHKIFKCAM